MAAQVRPELIYTPVQHIPLGEPVRTESGNLALKLKYKDRTEVISLDHIFALVLDASKKMK